ncbi:MAG: hypothetical protein ACRDT6_22830 [Micromonosporaceae bacterium]
MGHWLVVVPQERLRAERLYHHDTLELSTAHAGEVADGDTVAVAAGEPPVVFALGRVRGDAHRDVSDPDDPDAPEPDSPDIDQITIQYTHRLLDAPIPLDGPSAPAGQPASEFAAPVGQPVSLPASEFAALTRKIPPEYAVDAPRRSWLVSVDLPIEASSPAEAVRQFWSYVTQLGPAELPAFVAPTDDELALQAYVLGEQTNLDPEEADE